jgi:hypothetical protein
MKVLPFTLMNGNIYNLGLYNIFQRCALDNEHEDAINEAHAIPVGVHFQSDMKDKKIL